MKKELEQKLFEAVHKIGEVLEGELHIIDNTPEYPAAIGEKEYRVYHAGGYCFDVKKEVNTENKETGKPESWYYSFYSQWDDFECCSVQRAFLLVKQSKK